MTAAKRGVVKDAALDERRRSVDVAREALQAIRSAETDALVVSTADGDQLFSFTGVDRPYRLFVEATARGSLVASRDGVILSGNARIAEMSGIAREELIGSHLSVLFTEDPTASRCAAPPTDDAASPLEFVLRMRTGDELPVSVTASTIDLDGVPVTCLLVTDISQRRRSEEGNRFQAQLLDTVGEAIIVTDAQGVVTYVNRAAETLYGRSRTEFFGRPIAETTSPDASVPQFIDCALAGEPWAGESVLRRKDGTEFPAFVTVAPVFDETGALRATVGVSNDISRRKKAEAALVERERWFSTLVASSSDFILVISSEGGRPGRITFANEACTQFLGFDPTDSKHGFELVHPEMLTHFSLLENTQSMQESALVRVKDAHGAWRYVDARLTNCLDDPAINGIVINARDVTDNRKLSRALEAVSRVNEIIIHATDETELLEESCAALVEFGDYLLVWVGRPDHDADAIVHRIAVAGDARVLDELDLRAADTPLGQGPTGTAIRTRLPQIVASFASPQFGPWRDAIAKYNLASGCAFPLVLDDDDVWSLTLYSAEEDAFDAAAVAIFQQLADDLVFGIGRLRDAERLAQSEMHLRVAERLAHLGHWVWEIDADRFEFLADEGFLIHGITPGEWGHTFQSFLALVHPEDRAMVEGAFETAKTHGAAELHHRIVRPDGEVRHVMKRTEAVRGEDGRAVRIHGTCMDITEHVVAEAAREETGRYLAVITDNMAEGMVAVDMEGVVTFVNEAGARMLGWRPEELVGLPGHETYHSKRPDSSPYPVEDCPLVGVRWGGESMRVDQDVLVRRDGTLLPVAYSASPLMANQARGVVMVFHDISDRLSEQRRIAQELDKLAWVGRIRDALDQRRFVLYAQPIVDLQTGETVQHELLIRMLGPDGAVILPGTFLAAAEEFGLIAEIDRWVVKETARIAGLGIHVEFNLSAKSVMDPDMVSYIADALASARADPALVVCEITETSLLTEAAAGERFVRGLNAVGCKVALDDFGVGYGGFAYLKRLPVATLKIDREFISDVASEESSRNVIAAVVSLARAFSANTVAEGVEEMETVEVLKGLGVDCVQGFAVGHPVPLEEAFGARVTASARPKA